MILVDKNTKVIVQGATGKMGSTHTKRMLDYGTKIVGGVTPGKGGTKIHGVPVFDAVKEAVDATGATTSVIFVPPYYVLDAGYEALDAGIELIVLITEGVPPQDTAKLVAAVKAKGKKIKQIENFDELVKAHADKNAERLHKEAKARIKASATKAEAVDLEALGL